MRRLLILRVITGVALVAAGVALWQTLLDDLPEVSNTAGDRPENVVAVRGPNTAGQTFRPPKPNVSAVDLRLFGPQGVRLDGEIILHVRRTPQDETDLRSAAASARTLLRGAHTRFAFPPLDTTREETLYLFVEYPTGTADRPLQVRAELPFLFRGSAARPEGGPLSGVLGERASDYRDGALHFNHAAVAGDLDFRILRRGRRPFGAQAAAAAVLGGTALLVAVASTRARNSTFWGLLTLGIGLPIIFVLPLLKNISFHGIGDWDMNTTIHAAAAQALLQEKTFPGWNPYLCGGTPLAAFPEAPVFSPFFASVLLGGPVVGFKISVALHSIIGFLGMLLWLRRGWRVSWPAAFLGSSVVMFSSFVALHLGVGHSRKVAIAWVPWVLYFFQRALSERGADHARARSAADAFAPLRWTAPAGAFLALMFLDGSVYLSLYTAAFVVVVGVLSAVSRRAAHPLIAGLTTLLIGGFLAGIHLVPTLASQRSLHVTLDGATTPLRLRGLVDVFLDPNQSPDVQKFALQNLPWSEYGAYVGLAPIVLALLGVLRPDQRIRPWLGAGAFFLLGSFSLYAQKLLMHVPILGDLRNPQRMVVMVTVVVGIAAALGFDRLSRWLLGHPPSEGTNAVRAALGTLAVIIIGHLIFVNTKTFASTFTIPPPPASAARFPPTSPASAGLVGTRFRQGWAPRHEIGITDSFALTMANTLQNQGSVNRCSVASVQPTGSLRLPPAGLPNDVARAYVDEEYQGEAFLLDGRGTATVEKHETSRVRVRYAADTPTVLALNQNFHPGWRVRIAPDGESAVHSGPAIPHAQLVATSLEAGSGTVTFSYVPPGLRAGLLTSTIGLGLTLGIWRRGTALARGRKTND